jgi:hypothetical protein
MLSAELTVMDVHVLLITPIVQKRSPNLLPDARACGAYGACRLHFRRQRPTHIGPGHFHVQEMPDMRGLRVLQHFGDA